MSQVLILDSSDDEDELDLLGASRKSAPAGNNGAGEQLGLQSDSKVARVPPLARSQQTVSAGGRAAARSGHSTSGSSKEPPIGGEEGRSEQLNSLKKAILQLEIPSEDDDDDEESAEEAAVHQQLVPQGGSREVIFLDSSSDVESEPTPPPAEEPALAAPIAKESLDRPQTAADQPNNTDELALVPGPTPRDDFSKRSPSRPKRRFSSSIATPRPPASDSQTDSVLQHIDQGNDSTPRPRTSQATVSSSGRRIPGKKLSGSQGPLPWQGTRGVKKELAVSPQKPTSSVGGQTKQDETDRWTAAEVIDLSSDEDEMDVDQAPVGQASTSGVAPLAPASDPASKSPPAEPDPALSPSVASPPPPPIGKSVSPLEEPSQDVVPKEAELIDRPSPFLASPSSRTDRHLTSTSSLPSPFLRPVDRRRSTVSAAGTDEETDQLETEDDDFSLPAAVIEPLRDPGDLGDLGTESSEDECEVVGVNATEEGEGKGITESSDDEGRGSTTARHSTSTRDASSSEDDADAVSPRQPGPSPIQSSDDRSSLYGISAQPVGPPHRAYAHKSSGGKAASRPRSVARKSTGSPTLTRNSDQPSPPDPDVEAPSPARSKHLTARKSSNSGPSLVRSAVIPPPRAPRGRQKGHASASASTSGSSKRKTLQLADCIDLTMSSDEEAQRAAGEAGMGAIAEEEDLESSDDEEPPATSTGRLSPQKVAIVAAAQAIGADAMDVDQAEQIVQRAGRRAPRATADIALSSGSTSWTADDDRPEARKTRRRVSDPAPAPTDDSPVAPASSVAPAPPAPRVQSSRIIELARASSNLVAPKDIDEGISLEEEPAAVAEEDDFSSDEEPLAPEVATQVGEQRTEFFAEERALRPCYRKIAGPSFPGELKETQDLVRHVRSRDLRLEILNPDAPLADPADTRLFEALIAQANLTEIPCDPTDLPRVRVIPPVEGEPPFSPPWELCYTNRVVYSDRFAPEQSPGCDCEGDCGSAENLGHCKCRRRQERASTRRDQLQDPCPRSGAKGFAYTANGLLREGMEFNEPIWECNSGCGCDSSCINRVVGSGLRSSIDIVHTGKKGWAIRNPPSYTYQLWEGDKPRKYQSRVIPKGTAMGVYAAELISAKAGRSRDGNLYSELSRNYIFEVDSATVMEDIRLAQPDLAHTVPSYHQSDEEHRAAKPPARRKAPRSSKSAQLGEADHPHADDMVPSVNLDAFHYGNWTRFANHACVSFNTAIRPVYVDEGNISRPLFVFFAIKDIQPGEEIAITYHGDVPRQLGRQESLVKYKRFVAELREAADPSWRCYCGDDLCRGVMFRGGAGEALEQEQSWK